jgi:hypothetical protein
MMGREMTTATMEREAAGLEIAEMTIPSRFNGPATSGNGGYSAGVVARFLPTPAEVTLRTPPPLDRALRIVSDGEGGVRMMDDESLIAEGRPTDLPWIEPPVRPSLDQAQAARASHPGIGVTHPLSDCFVCGPRRADGLHVSSGPLPGHEHIGATPFQPDETVADEDGIVPGEVVWAALDCPSYVPAMWFALQSGRSLSLLGRLSAERMRDVHAGEDLVVIGWQLSADGRKRHTASAILDADGGVVAQARATWIELKG